MSVSSTSASLLSRARAQDSGAWERLVELYAPLALHWIHRRGVRGGDAEDVLQESFRSAAAGIHRFGAGPGEHNFRGWLRTVVQSKVANHFSKLDRLPVYESHSALNRRSIQEPSESEQEDTEQALKVTLLNEAIASLRAKVKADTFRVFELSFLQGRDAKSVADELDMNTGAVRVAKSRMLARLRAELGDRE